MKSSGLRVGLTATCGKSGDCDYDYDTSFHVAGELFHGVFQYFLPKIISEYWRYLSREILDTPLEMYHYQMKAGDFFGFAKKINSIWITSITKLFHSLCWGSRFSCVWKLSKVRNQGLFYLGVDLKKCFIVAVHFCIRLFYATLCSHYATLCSHYATLYSHYATLCSHYAMLCSHYAMLYPPPKKA